MPMILFGSVIITYSTNEHLQSLHIRTAKLSSLVTSRENILYVLVIPYGSKKPDR